MIEFLSVSLIILLAVISPGPDFAIVTRNSLRYSQRIGIMTTLGITTSTLFHASYCIFGLAIVISKSLLLFNIIKYVGAAYLIYLGIKGLLDKSPAMPLASNEKSKKTISDFQAYYQGLFCNVLNPKTILFFLALFTMMIKPNTSLMIQFGYALEIAFIHLMWFSLVSVFFAHQRIKVFLGKFLHYITKALGGFLIIFGAKVATLSR